MLQTLTSDSPQRIDGLVPEWRNAADRSGASLYLTPEWILSLWESHFACSGIDFVIDRHDGLLRSVFPFRRHTHRKLGIGIRQTELLTNNYGQNHNELASFPPDETTIRHYFDALDLAAWDVAYLASVPDDSQTMKLLLAEAAVRNHSFSLEANVSSPYLPLPPDWDSFLASKSANFRSDMRRKWHKAISAGLTVQVVSAPNDADSALDAILAIEANSWKEREGTSIPAQELSLRFYRRFLPRAAERGWLRIYVVFESDRPIAYDMGILLRGKYYMLKTSFVDQFATLSPGVFLRQYVIKDLMTLGGVEEHDFLGGSEAYKLRWTTLSRTHSNIFVYNKRSLTARTLCVAKKVRRHFDARFAPSTPDAQS